MVKWIPFYGKTFPSDNGSWTTSFLADLALAFKSQRKAPLNIVKSMLKFIWKLHSLNELWLIDLYLDYSSRESKKNSDLFLAENLFEKTVKKWLKA